jgi:hypothetical protein
LWKARCDVLGKRNSSKQGTSCVVVKCGE